MLKNHFLLAIRSLWKNKVSTIINILGLTTGLASCLLITLFIRHELSFDDFQPNGDRIARVIMEYSFDGGSESAKGDYTSTKVAPVMSRTFPEVERALRLSSADAIIRNGDDIVTDGDFLYVDSTFFEMFAYELVQGDSRHALDGPDKLVLTETAAKRYFGDDVPIGKTLYIGSDARPYDVTAVIKDYPRNSQFHFSMLGSFSSLGENQEKTYFNANYTTYLQLKDQHSIATLQQKLGPFMQHEMKGEGAKIAFELEQFDRIHLHSPYSANVPNTSMSYLFILMAIAGLILMIVCFTYVNLSTARSFERAREVGVRKVSGAGRGQLFMQFIGESFLVCALSVLVSFILAALVLPSFSSLIQKPLALSGLLEGSFVGWTFAGTIVISFLAGCYPAMVLSGLQPARVLKGVFKNTASAKFIQQSLVVFQFAISILLIVGTIVIQRQLHYIQNRNLGYDRDQVIAMRINWDTPLEKAILLKQELGNHPGVLSISRTSSSPVNIYSGYTMSSKGAGPEAAISVNANPIDEDYLELNGLTLIAGENITAQDMISSSIEDWDKKDYHFILNESAARRLGWSPEEAIGKEMTTQRPGIVRGVVQDFNFQSMHEKIKPLVLFTAPSGGRLLLRLSKDNTPETIAFLESKWKELMPNRPFEYHFLDEEFNRMYQSELQLGKAMNIFATIAIVLATLGLFGLSSYIVQQRTKEIGIRKVMGASLTGLMTVVSRRFVNLVIIAVVVGSPVAYWVMEQWLSGFSYRVEVSWWIFALAGVLTMLVALITVGIHGWKASTANPVKSLRSE